jgi:hypothetical protein
MSQHENRPFAIEKQPLIKYIRLQPLEAFLLVAISQHATLMQSFKE